MDLKLVNGPTTARATGTIDNPLAFAGTKVKLEFAGPNMALLLPLTGIAIPETPPYRVAGQLDYGARVVSFNEMTGKVGSSALAGDLSVETKPARPGGTAALRDVGAGMSVPLRRSDSGPIDGAVSVGFHGERWVGPDDVELLANMFEASYETVAHRVCNLSDPRRRGVPFHFQRVDVDKLLAATGVARGAGAIGGRAVIEGEGKSLAEILARGNGEVRLYMGAGGDLSALLVDLSGLQFGNALLSALGIPTRAKIQCLITDFVLKNGEAQSRLTMLDTNEARIGVQGSIDLRRETLDLVLRTDGKHFSVGSVPTPIDLGGTLGNPSIKPELAEGGARAAAAVGLGIALTPLAALLPTIQLGTGEDGACAGMLKEIKAPPRTRADQAPRRRR